MSESITFGGWLKQNRKEQGMGHDELAELIGCSASSLLKIESGERRPSRQLALLLAEHFHIPSDEREPFIAFARNGISSPTTLNGATIAKDNTSVIAAQSPWRTARAHKTNLPTILTPLIGREQDVQEISGLLFQPRVRLLTLIGAPGIGKTRLALQIASSLINSGYFDDGVYLVELAPVTDPDLVLSTIAQALDLNEQVGTPIERILLDYTQERRALLLLDNFEQILDAGPSVAKLLERSPWLKVLVTSREALHVSGERRYIVQPLSLPDVAQATSPETIAQYSSVELFVELAKAVVPDFEITQENAKDIGTLCVRLDGLPLAIELAAARARLFTPGEMLNALDHRLTLLTRGARDLAMRHRTLQGAIEWSHRLLNEREQRLFPRLSVFVGGFSPEAVRAVCSQAQSANEDNQPFATLDEVASLADKSLIKEVGRAGQLRFGMLETIREYAANLLQDAGEKEDTELRHAEYYLHLVEGAESHMGDDSEVVWLDKLEEDYENLRAVLDWTLVYINTEKEATTSRARKIEIGLGMCAALESFWNVRGYISEGRERCEAILHSADINERVFTDNADDYHYQLLKAKALYSGATLARIQGDFTRANSLSYESVAISKKIHYSLGTALALAHTGYIDFLQGDYASSRTIYEECLRLGRETKDREIIARALLHLGLLDYKQGDFASARTSFEESLALWREAGNKRGINNTLNNLGMVMAELGDYTSARMIYEDSLALRRELGDKRGIAQSLSNLGTLLWLLGDYDNAREQHEISLSVLNELGDKSGSAYGYLNLGRVVQSQGDNERARVLYTQSIKLAQELDSKYIISVWLICLGALEAAQQCPEKAVRLFGAANALLNAIGVVAEIDDRITYEQGIITTRAQLDEATWDKVYNEGKSMALEQAIAYGLSS